MSNWEDKTKLEEQTFRFFIKGMRVLWELFGKEKKLLLLMLVYIALISGFAHLFPVLLKLLIDEMPNLKVLGKFSSYSMWLFVVMYIVMMIKINFHRLGIEIPFVKAIIRLENAWPVMAQKKLLELSLGYHEMENTGKKISKINKGCERLIDIMCRLRWGFIPQIYYMIINVTIILVMDWRLGLIFMAPLAPAAYLYLRAFRTAAKMYEKWEVEKERADGKFIQSIINIPTVLNYVQEKREIGAFCKIRKKMEILDTDAMMKMQPYFLFAVILLWTFYIGAIAVGILLFITNRGVTTGTLVYLAYTGFVTLENIWAIVHEYTEILKRLISVMRLKELLDEKPEIVDAPDAYIPKNFKGEFRFKDLIFKYPRKEAAVLNKINLKFKPGEMIALAGKSGEGKTTIVKLLCRMFDVNSGAVQLDGIDIRKFKKNWYRRNFAIVQQDVDIFDGSVLENVRYVNPEIKREKAIEAVRAAHLHEILDDTDKFPNGIDEEVGEKGVRLSGGQKQRVGIARAYLALLNGARVLILDEATSSLDSEAERAIQGMLTTLRRKSSISIVAIAHRLSTIQRADKIFVINNGRIAEEGSHNRLMQRNGLYAKLADLQRLGELRE